MKRRFLICTVLALILLVSFSAFTVSPASAVSDKPESQKNEIDTEAVLEARFLNMLNHNFAYNEAFDTVEDLTNASMPALLKFRDSGDESFISEIFVKEYLFNMYGVETDSLSEINSDFPQKSGYVYIIPRGFSVFTHSIESVTENEDGSYTVITSVAVDAHDGEDTATAKTLFVRNEKSDFGFNIIFSDIFYNMSAA